MRQPNTVVGIEQILLADSYVLSFCRRGKDIAIQMEFTLASDGLGHMVPGQVIFPDVENEEWHRGTGELSSLEKVNECAHRYNSGPNEDGSHETPDIGCIDSIRFADGNWQVVGDWGSCCLRTHGLPTIVFGQQCAREDAPCLNTSRGDGMNKAMN
jgi:hypothetical protein